MLTDRECKTAKVKGPNLKAFKLYDSGGLYLLVKMNGSKLWQVKYKFNGKARTFSIGQYGEGPGCVGLAEARIKRDAAKALLREGRDPTLAKRMDRSSAVGGQLTTVKQVCEEWIERNAKKWSKKQTQNVRNVFEADVYPIVGTLPIAEVTETMVLRKILRPIDERGANEVCRRVRQRLSAVYRFASANGYVPKGYDPAGVELLEALSPKPRVRRQPAIVHLPELREMMWKVEATPSKATTKLATRFIALTVVRVGTLMAARWEQFKDLDGDAPVWDIPKENMKGVEGEKLAFMVPLCRQAVDVLNAAKEIGEFPWVFPSDIRPDQGPISNNAILFHLYRSGYRGRHTAHGFRASFSTFMNEKHPLLNRVIDFALAHVPPGTVEAAYNRAEHLETRRALHQEYADLLLDGFPPASSLLDGKRR